MKTIQKADLVEDIYRRTNGVLSRREIELVMRAEKASIVDFLSQIYKVQIAGLLTIEPTIQKPRKGRNITTGKPISIPEKPTVKYRSGAGIDRAIEKMTLDGVRVAQTAPARSPKATSATAKTRDGFAQDDKTRGDALDKLNKK